MAYKITDQERQALYGLPHLQQLVYLRGIRPFMDFNTYAVGIIRKVSYRSLSEECQVLAHQGYAALFPSRDQMRRAVAGLERAGVISVKSSENQLIFKCLLASQDQCVQKKVATKPPSLSATPMTAKNCLPLGLTEQDLKKPTIPKMQKAATHLVSGKDKKKYIRAGALIDVNFKPSELVLARIKDHDGEHNGDELAKFVAYYREKSRVSLDWNEAYFRWVLNSKRFQAEKKSKKNQKENFHDHFAKKLTASKTSAVDRVRTANDGICGRLIEHDDGDA
ncbi:MAG: hypothetical protein K0U12_04500 [Gammaproteobacteria bacterium]|nr:hypothetical protein [Gammaproteobacteria bacterium]